MNTTLARRAGLALAGAALAGTVAVPTASASEPRPTVGGTGQTAFSDRSRRSTGTAWPSTSRTTRRGCGDRRAPEPTGTPDGPAPHGGGSRPALRVSPSSCLFCFFFFGDAWGVGFGVVRSPVQVIGLNSWLGR